jgi:hypothetical protein
MLPLSASQRTTSNDMRRKMLKRSRQKQEERSNNPSKSKIHWNQKKYIFERKMEKWKSKLRDRSNAPKVRIADRVIRGERLFARHVKRVQILHHKLARTQQTETRPHLVAVLLAWAMVSIETMSRQNRARR